MALHAAPTLYRERTIEPSGTSSASRARLHGAFESLPARLYRRGVVIRGTANLSVNAQLGGAHAHSRHRQRDGDVAPQLFPTGKHVVAQLCGVLSLLLARRVRRVEQSGRVLSRLFELAALARITRQRIVQMLFHERPSATLVDIQHLSAQDKWRQHRGARSRERNGPFSTGGIVALRVRVDQQCGSVRVATSRHHAPLPSSLVAIAARMSLSTAPFGPTPSPPLLSSSLHLGSPS